MTRELEAGREEEEEQLVTIERELERWEGRDRPGRAPPPYTDQAQPCEPPRTLFGLRASDIERYSRCSNSARFSAVEISCDRIVFPVSFLCFHLVYWAVLVRVSNVTPGDLIPLHSTQ